MLRQATDRSVSADSVFRRLSSLAPLSPVEVDLVYGLTTLRDRWAPEAEIQPQGAVIRKPRVILSGWACQQRAMANGRRQIVEFLIPGDAIGVCAQAHPRALAATVALTPVETADAGALQAAIRGDSGGYPGLVQAGELAATEERARLMDHIVRLGRLSALERMAHLLLELHDRLERAGHAREGRFPMPLTQETLADATGLSLVHVNRTLQQLRREQLIELRAGFVALLQPEQLALAADYRRITTDDLRVRA